MNKIIISLLCLQLVSMPVFSTELFQDSLVEQTLKGKDLKINKAHSDLIQDSFVEKTLQNIQSKQYSSTKQIEDELVNKTLSNKKYEIQKQENTVITDNFADKTLKNIPVKTKNADIKFDFESIKRVPIKISITQNLSTKRNLKEGQGLSFKVVNDVTLDKKLKLKKDTIISAKLETVSLNQAFGIPADIVIDDFKTVSGQSAINLEGNIHKIGANRSLWVYPVGYATGIMFFGAGFLLFTVRGGHAKLNTKDKYEIYYCPNL